MSSTKNNLQTGTSSAKYSQNSQSALNVGKDGGGGASAAHGQEFHLRLAMLLVLRLVELKQNYTEFEYRIWLEKSGYGKFDDIVLKYKIGSGKWIQICFQCKSGEEKSASDGSKFVSNVTAHDFLSVKKTSFSLLDYLKSFSTIKDTMKDCDSYFVLITNREYSGNDDGKYLFLQREKIDLASAEMFSGILVGKAFSIKYTSEFEKHILKLNKNIDPKTIDEFCKKFLFVSDNRKLDVEVHDKLYLRSKGNEEKSSNWNARLRCLVLDMYQQNAEPTHSDFLNLLNSINIHYKNHPAHPMFTGRVEDVKYISTALHNKKGGNILDLSITGMAGIGKTQVVSKYIDNNIHRFKHIIWINADNKHTLDSSFVDLAKTCQLIKEDGKHEIAFVTKVVYDFFSEETLFVFDNADEVLLLQGNPGEYIYLPNNAAYCKNRFIVISQITKWTTNYAVSLETFSEEEALMYLDKVIADCKQEEKQDLAASVQYWPLALSLAASYIKLETDNSSESKRLSDTIKSIKIDTEKLHTHLPQQYELEPYNASLRSLWQMIQKNLITKCDKSLKILYILSFSSPDNFPIELIKFDSCTEDDVVRAISILRDNSLVTIGVYNMSIHRALQAVIRNSVVSDPDLHNDIIVLGTVSIEKYLTAMNEFERVKTLGNIHMLTFLQQVSKSNVQIQTYFKMAGLLFRKLVDSYDILILGNNDNIFEQILLKIKQHFGDKYIENTNMLHTKALMLQNMGKYAEALSIHNHVIEVKMEKLGENHPNTMTSMNSKASVLRKMGKYDDALSIYNHVIYVLTEKLGIDHPDTMTSMHNKASVLDKMGKYDEALSSYNRVIEIRTEKLGKDHPDTITSMNNKASVLNNMGKYDVALSIHNHVIKVETEKLGENHPNTMTSMHSKASVLCKIGKYDEALRIYNQVTEVMTEKLGKDHPDTMTSMHNKALVLDKMGKYDEALGINNLVIEVQTEKLGKDHPDTITSKNNKALVLHNMGKYDEALNIYNHVIEVMTETLGKDHPDTMTSMQNKATVLDNMGKYDEALSILNHVIEVQAAKLGKDHPGTLTSMPNKALVLYKMGRYDEALIIYNRVIEVRTEKLGEDHLDTISSMNNKASVLNKMGKYDEAVSIYNHVIEVESEKLGNDHPDIITSMNNKALVLDNMGKCEEALDIYNHVIDVLTEKVGKDHPSTLTSMNNKASVLDKMRKYDEALIIYNHVINVLTEILGKYHPYIITCMNSKAVVLNKMGKYDEALSILNQLIEVQTEILGKDHSSTITSMQNKASVLIKIGKHDEALIIYNHVIEIWTEMLGMEHPYTISSINNRAKLLNKM